MSRTENENAITLYNYDEFGQVTRTLQVLTIANPGKIITVDYAYDYFGNVTEVAYQKDIVDERFYHHYSYDINQRLTDVYTSRNGTDKTLRARYHYYLHGPLKRTELFDGNEQLQGIDYTYTINGALKSINHADPALDPGGDSDDVFGTTLQYFDGDYTGADYSAGSQTISGVADRYSGLLKAMSWHSPGGDHEKQTYTYQYDDRNQLTDATWGSMTGSAGAYGFSAGSAQAYREAVPGYDKNGNIQSLIRKGKEGRPLAGFDYVYEANTNRLDKVNENSAVLIDYSYNAIGQLTRLQEGEDKDFEIRYNAYGLVAEILDKNDNDNVLQSYHYDDRGNLLQKVYYTGGVAQLYTTYVTDVSGNVLAIYLQETATLEDGPVEVPVYGAGRLAVYKPTVSTYFYEVSDHLGNVRAVIGVAETDTYLADFETTTNTDFENYSRHDDDLMDHTDVNDEVYTYSQLLNGGYAGRIGVARSVRVTPGDVVKVEAYGKYRDLTGTPASLEGFAAALTAAFGLQSGLPGDPGMAYGALHSYGTAIAGGFAHHEDPDAPKAYLNILLFDKNFIFVDAAYTQLSGDAEQVGTSVKAPHDYLMREVTVTEAGYAYIFVSNENPEQVDVHFDDVTITHTHSNIVAGADYYPFGLAMDGREIDDEPYRWGYQGQYSERDTITGWNQFQLRFYDAKIARWLSADPYGQYYSPYKAMGNAPHMGVDPDGGLFGLSAGWSALAGAGIGFAVGAGAAVLTGNEDDWWKWGAIGAVAGGTIGYFTGDKVVQHGSENARSITGGKKHNNVYSTRQARLKHPRFSEWQEKIFDLAVESDQVWNVAKEYALHFERKKQVKKLQFSFNEFWGSSGQWVSRNGKEEMWDVNRNWDWLDTPIFGKRGTYSVTHYQIFPNTPAPTIMPDGTSVILAATPVLDIKVTVRRQIHGRYGKTISYGWRKIGAP